MFDISNGFSSFASIEKACIFCSFLQTKSVNDPFWHWFPFQTIAASGRIAGFGEIGNIETWIDYITDSSTGTINIITLPSDGLVLDSQTAYQITSIQFTGLWVSWNSIFDSVDFSIASKKKRTYTERSYWPTCGWSNVVFLNACLCWIKLCDAVRLWLVMIPSSNATLKRNTASTEKTTNPCQPKKCPISNGVRET